MFGVYHRSFADVTRGPPTASCGSRSPLTRVWL